MPTRNPQPRIVRRGTDGPRTITLFAALLLVILFGAAPLFWRAQ